MPEDWDHFHVLLQQLLKRVPTLSQAILHKLCNGLEAFSPDCKWIVGEAPEVSLLHYELLKYTKEKSFVVIKDRRIYSTANSLYHDVHVNNLG